MRKFALTFIAGLVGYMGLAQSFVFRYNQEELNDVQFEADIRSHNLGDEVATKLQLLKESYTYREKDKITLQERNVVEKPSIYYSVKKVDKYLKGEVKKERMTEAQATEQMVTVLNIALNIRYQNTEEFEDLLWKTKDGEVITKLYMEKVQLDM